VRRTHTGAVYYSIMDLGIIPGGGLVATGLRDAEQGIESDESLLVSIGAPRLARAGIMVTNPLQEPELRLYASLARAHGAAAHSRYNALVRRLVSFERAVECANW
jgi:hypothetical protein